MANTTGSRYAKHVAERLTMAEARALAVQSPDGAETWLLLWHGPTAATGWGAHEHPPVASVAVIEPKAKVARVGDWLAHVYDSNLWLSDAYGRVEHSVQRNGCVGLWPYGDDAIVAAYGSVFGVLVIVNASGALRHVPYDFGNAASTTTVGVAVLRVNESHSYAVHCGEEGIVAMFVDEASHLHTSVTGRCVAATVVGSRILAVTADATGGVSAVSAFGIDLATPLVMQTPENETTATGTFNATPYSVCAYNSSAATVVVLCRSGRAFAGVSGDFATLFWRPLRAIACVDAKSAPGSPICSIDTGRNRAMAVDMSRVVCFRNRHPSDRSATNATVCTIKATYAVSSYGAVPAGSVAGAWVESNETSSTDWEPEHRVAVVSATGVYSVYAYRFRPARATDWVEDLHRVVPLGAARWNAMVAANCSDVDWAWGAARSDSTLASAHYALAVFNESVPSVPCKFNETQGSPRGVADQICVAATGNLGDAGYRGIGYIGNDSVARAYGHPSNAKAAAVLHDAIMSGTGFSEAVEVEPSVFDFLPVTSAHRYRLAGADFVFAAGAPVVTLGEPPLLDFEVVTGFVDRFRFGNLIIDIARGEPPDTLGAVCDPRYYYVESESNGFLGPGANRIATFRVTSAQQADRVDPAPVRRARCVPFTICEPSSQYETKPATLATDRTCAPRSRCGATGYEISPGTVTTDRVCAPLTACRSPESYSPIGPTATSDRACVPTAPGCRHPDRFVGYVDAGFGKVSFQSGCEPCPQGTTTWHGPSVYAAVHRNDQCVLIANATPPGVVEGVSFFNRAAHAADTSRNISEAVELCTVCAVGSVESSPCTLTTDRRCHVIAPKVDEEAAVFMIHAAAPPPVTCNPGFFLNNYDDIAV